MKQTPFLNHCILLILYLFAPKHRVYCDEVDPKFIECAPIKCGDLNISFPFYIKNQQEPYCGSPGFDLICQNNNTTPILHIPGNDYLVQNIFYNNRSIRVANTEVFTVTGCLPEIKNLSLTEHKFNFPHSVLKLFLFSNCSSPINREQQKIEFCEEGAAGNGLVILEPGSEDWNNAIKACTKEVVVVPVELREGDEGILGASSLLEVMKKGFMLDWIASDCTECSESGGRCGFDTADLIFRCFCPDRPHRVSCKPTPIPTPVRNHTKLIIATVLSGSFAVTAGVFILLFCQRKRFKLFSYLPSLRNSSSNPSSKKDLELATEYFGASVFTYEELEEATKNFDPSRELGDGGFGTVYHGKLSDGREVAVKRLYEHNYKRVMQFMNEVQILTSLRHRNLVTLYGCTSRQSRELLLVYEYIRNGTVADHLHGDLAHKGLLTWPIRMNIAIETATALLYLHHTGIIHRDVKTTNILLDTNFSVKVADFGLSKYLPENVTHVSTAPQGTPGYVDPEYYQCYQLSEKSDVYSFGVVLVELISSMPAVDISRHRHEINLSNLAINRIQNCAFDDLIDPILGYKSDSSVKRMTTSMAELAFQCLQNDKDFRPTMDEVVESLNEIREYSDDKMKQGPEEMKMPPPPSPEGDTIILLKGYTGLPGMSPDTVTAKWVSGSSINSS